MEKKPIQQKIKSAIIVLLLVGLPGLLLMPVTSSTIPDWDVNQDGACNLLDIVRISNHIGESGTPGWIREDVDNNGHVNVLDMILVSNHYGESGYAASYAKIQKLSIMYDTSINANAQQFIAQHFDMLDCDRAAYTAASNIKALNPDIKIIGYYDAILEQSSYSDWNYVNQFEDWFVHDKSGNRIRNVNYGGPYLMNPDSGWSDYIAQRCQDFLQNYPQYDGIFADDVPFNLSEAGYQWTVPYSNFENGVIQNWGAWMLQHVQNIQTTIGSKIIMPNAWKYTQFCENITGVHVWEGFVHGRSHNVSQPGYGEWYTLYAINRLKAQAQQGNIISVISGCKNADYNPTLAHQYMLFTLICFLFSVEDMQKSYYAWNFFNEDASDGWYPEMDYEFGNPVGDYYNVQGSVYARQFENATVVANINPTTTYDIVIDGTPYEIGARIGLIIPK